MPPAKESKLHQNRSNWASFERTHQTKQLLWRHHMVIYYGMCGITVWMGQTHENKKNFQKFITFRKSNELEKSFWNIAVGRQHFIFAS